MESVRPFAYCVLRLPTNHAQYGIPAGIRAARNAECDAIIAVCGRIFGTRTFDRPSRFRSFVSTRLSQAEDSPEIREAEIAVTDVKGAVDKS